MPKMLHYRVWRGRAWVALATAAILSAGLPSAAADTGNAEVVSSTLPAGVPIPSLSALQAQQSSKGTSALPDRETAAGKLPREAIAPARSGPPKASTPSFLSDEMAGRVPFAATYPEPPRTMTKGECKAGLQGGRLFAVKSRYAMCTGTQLGADLVGVPRWGDFAGFCGVAARAGFYRRRR